jgi:single-strand DNA-binding protein
MFNKIFLLGNLGKDPEVKYFDENNLVVNFPLATNETYVDKTGNRVTQTEWHNIKINRPGLGKVAEQYLKKGDMIFIEGKVKTRNYDDQQGNKRYITEVIVETMKMTGKRSGGEGGSEESRTSDSHHQPEAADPFANPPMSDDLPF